MSGSTGRSLGACAYIPTLPPARSKRHVCNIGRPLTSVSAGHLHSCGVTTGGEAYCWGFNPSGQLGDGSRITRLTPVVVQGGLDFEYVTAGENHSCGVTADNEVYCWGLNLGRLGDGTIATRLTPVVVQGGLDFVSVSVGSGHSCGVTTEGEAYCWGWSHGGQLGHGGPTQPHPLTPVAVAAFELSRLRRKSLRSRASE